MLAVGHGHREGLGVKVRVEAVNGIQKDWKPNHRLVFLHRFDHCGSFQLVRQWHVVQRHHVVHWRLVGHQHLVDHHHPVETEGVEELALESHAKDQCDSGYVDWYWSARVIDVIQSDSCFLYGSGLSPCPGSDASVCPGFDASACPGSDASDCSDSDASNCSGSHSSSSPGSAAKDCPESSQWPGPMGAGSLDKHQGIGSCSSRNGLTQIGG